MVKDLHDYRVSVTIHAVIVCLLFGLAAYALWRGAGIARWLYMVAALFFSVGGVVALSADGPALSNFLSFIVALAAIAAVVLLLLPESTRYFAATKAQKVPVGAAGPRPAGLRGLFSPPPPA